MTYDDYNGMGDEMGWLTSTYFQNIVQMGDKYEFPFIFLDASHDGLLNKEFNNEKWWYLSNTHGDFNLICICNVGKTMP